MRVLTSVGPQGSILSGVMHDLDNSVETALTASVTAGMRSVTDTGTSTANQLHLLAGSRPSFTLQPSVIGLQRESRSLRSTPSPPR
jgi:hypothetical protein